MDIVRDIDDATTLCFQCIDDSVDVLHLRGSELVGKLIENKDLRFDDESTKELDQELLVSGQVPDFRMVIDEDTVAIHELLKRCLHLPIGDHSSTRGQLVGEYEVQGLEVWDDRGILIHRSDALPHRRSWSEIGNLLAVEADCSRACAFRTAEDFHECRFTCPVLTGQCVDLTLEQIEIYPLQGL